jgi:hypothetical protein
MSMFAHPFRIRPPLPRCSRSYFFSLDGVVTREMRATNEIGIARVSAMRARIVLREIADVIGNLDP